ncbi:MAG: hypothetical protein IT555_04030 [Acetobacteraceae bacterium]|nr:hypothetical protein [Acetobacteraceae bacterium]
MPRLAVPIHLLAALLTTVALVAGCSSGTAKFAPTCPQLALLAEGADLVRFAGAGRDVTDRVLEARVAGVDASCKMGSKDAVVAVVKVTADIARGPAARGRVAQVPYFVAVMDGDTVLDWREFTLQANFPANVESLRVAGDELELRFPGAGDNGAGRYKIIVSLQLTEEELAYNRRASHAHAPR